MEKQRKQGREGKGKKTRNEEDMVGNHYSKMVEIKIGGKGGTRNIMPANYLDTAHSGVLQL